MKNEKFSLVEDLNLLTKIIPIAESANHDKRHSHISLENGSKYRSASYNAASCL